MFVTMLFTISLLLITSINGFLLDGNNPQGGGQTGTGQYMSLSSFYDQKRQIDYRIEQVQRDDDNKLNILTSQILQKFNALEASAAKCGNSNSNSSSSSVKAGDFEHKYKELELNHLNLQQKYDALETKYNVVISEVDRLRSAVNTKQSSQEVKLESVKNKTVELARQFLSISQFKDVQGLSDYQSLKQNVRNLETQTGLLFQKDKVRSQDFLALYNQTLTTRSTINALDARTTKELNVLQQQMNTSSKHIDTVERNLDVYKTFMNTTVSTLEAKLEESTERGKLMYRTTMFEIDIVTANDHLL